MMITNGYWKTKVYAAMEVQPRLSAHTAHGFSRFSHKPVPLQSGL
ncbi:MAG: hypothetical protein ACO1N7_10935 [Sphingobacteriaceae bacterium]